VFIQYSLNKLIKIVRADAKNMVIPFCNHSTCVRLKYEIGYSSQVRLYKECITSGSPNML